VRRTPFFARASFHRPAADARSLFGSRFRLPHSIMFVQRSASIASVSSVINRCQPTITTATCHGITPYGAPRLPALFLSSQVMLRRPSTGSWVAR